MERKKVLFVAPSAEKFTGGPSANTGNFMKSCAFRDFDVRLVDTTPPDLPYGNVKRLVHSGLLFSRLASAIREHRPSAAYIQASSGLGFYEKALMALFCQSLGTGVVLHLVSGRFDGFARHDAVNRKLVSSLLDKIDVVACVGSRWARFVQEIAPHARTAELVNPVDVASIPVFSVERARSKTSRNVRFLFLAIMVEQKGPFDLIRAVVLRRADLVGRAQIVMAGSGDALAAARALISDLGVGDMISTPGFVSEAEKSALLGSSDVFVAPSHIEGLPVAILEAMSAALPVIASDAGAISDVVDSSNGILVPPQDVSALGEALVKMVEMDEKRIRLGADGRRRVLEKYDIDRAGAALEALWTEVADKRCHQSGRGRDGRNIKG